MLSMKRLPLPPGSDELINFRYAAWLNRPTLTRVMDKNGGAEPVFTQYGITKDTVFAITFDKETGMFDLVQNVARKLGATEQEVIAIERELGVAHVTPPAPPTVAELDDTSDLDGIE